VTMLDCTWPCVVVARPGQELPPLHTECELVFDEHPGEGPLAAIATGMRAVAGHCDAVFVVGCDLPFVTAETVAALAEALGSGRGIVPEAGGVLHPLCAIYRTELLPEIERLVEGGERRAQALADLPGVARLPEDRLRAFDPELRFLRDVDTPESYDAARRDDGQI